MKAITYCMCAALVGLLGCDKVTATQRGNDRPTVNQPELRPGETGPSAPNAVNPQADNTRRNARSGDLPTPGDQGESDIDRTMTQNIRKAVVADKGLGMTAKNVKIITKEGHVTLRGPVSTPQEKAIIDDAAKKVAGANNVDDQLEVTGK